MRPGRLVMWVIVFAAIYVFAKAAQMYFYVAAFDDFVKDEVKFAPTREGTDDDHLRGHITDAAGQYGVDVNPRDIQITKTHRNAENSEIQTLTVQVPYAATLDLYLFKPQLQFHSNADISY